MRASYRGLHRPALLDLAVRALPALIACLTPRVASASPLFELLGDTQGSGGFSPRASGPGAASAYFNPALLTDASSGITLGFFYLTEQIGTHLDARASSPSCSNHACDVPVVGDSGPQAFRHQDGSPIATPALPTAWLENGRVGSSGAQVLAPRPRQAAGTGQSQHGYLALGLVQTLAERRLALGLYTLLPLDDFMRASAFYPDEREQFFSNSLHPELYSDRLSAASIAFGAGGRLSDSLSLGLALTLAIKSGARAPAYVSNLSDLDTLLLDSDVGVSVSFAPHAALSYQPYERLRLSGTVHSPQAVDIETRVSYIIATGLEQRAEQTFTHAYLPWIFGLGAEFAFGPAAVPHWSAVASAQYALWSQYRDRHGVRPTAPYAFRNVLGASIGMRYTSAGLSGLIDVVFQPSPVPPQRGRSNYVDNDRAGLALAASYAFSLWGHGAELGLATQLHRLLSQAVRKLPGTSVDSVRDELPDDAIGGTPRGPIIGREGLQTNNPGFPGFSSGGFLFGAGLHFKVAY